MRRRDFLKTSALFSLFGGGALLPSAAALAFNEHQAFPHPQRIRYDGLSFFVENKPYYLFSGSFHYFRCPQALWAQRFEKIREAGFNTVQTYVPWNYHERTMPAGLHDFSKIDLTELSAWMAMAQKYGLHMIIRAGPYVCGEWDTGGFPQWLLTKQPPHFRGQWLRSDEPHFVEWSRHWYDALCPLIAAQQITRKQPGRPGVILMQVENEYMFAGVPLPAKKRYAQTLIDQARRHGINVPLFMNLSGFVLNSQRFQREVFDTIDRYPGWMVDAMVHRMEHFRRDQRGAPVMAAELQGGWFTPVAQAPALRTRVDAYARALNGQQIANLTLYSMANGMTAMNYYMLFGGTNFGTWAGAGIATSYDYSAPIRECGGVGEKFQAVSAIGAMLQKHGPALARSVLRTVRGSSGNGAVKVFAREAPNRDVYLFVLSENRSHTLAKSVRVHVEGHGLVHLRYRLGPGGADVLWLRHGAGAKAATSGEWLIHSEPLPRRPTGLPGAVAITSVRYQADTLPGHWRTVRHRESLVDLGVYASGFSYYRATVRRTSHSRRTPVAVAVELPGQDSVTAMIDGKLAFATSTSGSPAILPMHAGGADAMHVVLAYENIGHWNNGIGMQGQYGVNDVGLMPYHGAPRRPSGKFNAAGRLAGPLEFAPAPVGLAEHWQEPDFDDAHWHRSAPGRDGTVPEAALSWARLEFALPHVAAGVFLPWCLKLDVTGNALLYLNGRPIGRFWQHGGQREYFLPDCWLNTGGKKNVVALCMRPLNEPARVLAARVEPYVVYATKT